MKVEEERGPRGWLVLGDRGDDGNMLLGVGWVEEVVEAARPRGDIADHVGQDEVEGSRASEEDAEANLQEPSKALRVEEGLDEPAHGQESQVSPCQKQQPRRRSGRRH